MNPVLLLAEWAVRSSVLIGCGFLLLRLFRVKAPAIRLAAWTAILFGSLTIPVITVGLPKVPVSILPAEIAASEGPTFPQPQPLLEVASQTSSATTKVDWTLAAGVLYGVVVGTMLLRLCTGLILTRSMRRRSRPTGLVSGGVEVHESDEVAAPLTMGIFRSTVILPCDWRLWDRSRLEAVLAHETSHIRRKDPAVQLVAALHRAVLWHSPLSWMLHRWIIRVAEEASDDAAVAAISDRTAYAETLLAFMQRGVRGPNWQAVAMASYGPPEARIHRILDGKDVARRVTRWAIAAVFVLVAPLAYLTAAGRPARQITHLTEVAARAAMVEQAPSAAATAQAGRTEGPTPQPDTGRDGARIRRYMVFLGDTRSGSYDSRDFDEAALRARFGERFVWFQHAGNQYVVTDAGVLGQIEQAMEPQNKVNQMQDLVNQQQSVVNGMQSKVNGQQNAVNVQQQGVNQRQDAVNAAQQDGKRDQEFINRLQSEVNRLQSRVNEAQDKVNQEQSRVNAQQDKVNQEQGKVNEVQRRVSAEYSARIRQILNSVLERGLAKRLN